MHRISIWSYINYSRNHFYMESLFLYVLMSWNNENSNDNLWIIYALWIFWIQESFKHFSLVAAIQYIFMKIIFYFNFDSSSNTDEKHYWSTNHYGSQFLIRCHNATFNPLIDYMVFKLSIWFTLKIKSQYVSISYVVGNSKRAKIIINNEI